MERWESPQVEDVGVLWERLQEAKAAGDADRVTDLERRLRSVSDASREARAGAVAASRRRQHRRRGRVTLVAFVAATALVGLVTDRLTDATFIVVLAAVFAGLLTAAAVAGLVEPNRPYHPDAGREDRGFNYVRGEPGA